jgi:hypothetical protein
VKAVDEPYAPVIDYKKESTGPAAFEDAGLWRHSRWDALLVGLSLLHGAMLLTMPPHWVIALGLWWSANTISHNFIHLPFFRSRVLNLGFSAYLSAVLGFPQSLWRERHLAHHRGDCARTGRWFTHLEWQKLLEIGLVLGWWGYLLRNEGDYFVMNYLPGWLAGLALCQIQGHYEHVRGTLSHYSKLYNWLFFNDGFHVEHHAQPTRHWTRLPQVGLPNDATPQSVWPAVLRWLDWFSLNGLERWVLRSRTLQRFVLQRHEAAFRRMIPLRTALPALKEITIVGGGLFPRSALVLQKLAPDAHLRIVDARLDHLRQAELWLPEKAELVCQFYDSSSAVTPALSEADLLVIPLAFVGDKSAIYRKPPARRVLVHDWLWRKRGHSVVVSVLLLKRINLVLA